MYIKDARWMFWVNASLLIGEKSVVPVVCANAVFISVIWFQLWMWNMQNVFISIENVFETFIMRQKKKENVCGCVHFLSWRTIFVMLQKLSKSIQIYIIIFLCSKIQLFNVICIRSLKNYFVDSIKHAQIWIIHLLLDTSLSHTPFSSHPLHPIKQPL